MTVTTTVINPVGVYQPYVGIPGSSVVDQWETIIPSGEYLFLQNNLTVTAGGSGNEQQITIELDLPSGFAYSFVEMSLMLREQVTLDLDTWSAAAECFLTDNSNIPQWLSSMTFSRGPLGPVTQTATLNSATYRIVDPVKKIVIPGRVNPQGVGRLAAYLMNRTQNDGALSAWFFARFYRYELNQAFFYPLNTAVLTR